MADRFQAQRGTADVLPAEATARAHIQRVARELLERAGYARIETPIFEDTELFARGVGGSTDIVRKEMFTFEDKGGRSITLRPEATASICRAYLEHGMQKLPQPVKLWWYGSLFRHERPQAGRFRQFTQLDAEVIGSDSPLVDAELILLCDEFLRTLEVPELTLRIGSLGSPEARASYREELVAYLRKHESDLARDVRERIDENPLRAFDSKDESTQAVMADAPTMLDRLEGEDAEHFATVRRLLDQAGIEYELDGRLVRGLDYYTRTVFEFHSARLGAQSQVAGGGRYDRLIELLGGPPTPANGWAAGIERILLVIGTPEDQEPHDVFVAAEDSQRERALALVTELRRAGLRADLDLAGRGMKGQMRQADRVGAGHALILDADGSLQLRDMRSGEQREVEAQRVVEELSAG
ncbi:MAG: histidine--tRNA ligase [Actinobacteria bacterium]|jgi:histidyl-tRNA synthetase|nr:MAG: histidine--tRNA ligase [Actinomycetota bacterium]